MRELCDSDPYNRPYTSGAELNYRMSGVKSVVVMKSSLPITTHWLGWGGPTPIEGGSGLEGVNALT